MLADLWPKVNMAILKQKSVILGQKGAVFQSMRRLREMLAGLRPKVTISLANS